MARAKQLPIPGEDRPGTLARIAKLLEQSNINIVNIVPMNCATFGTHGGAIQILVDDPKKAEDVLDHQRLPYTEQDVLYLELENAPGCLAELAGKLAAQGINVTAGYATVVKGCKKAGVVLSVSDLETAARIH